MGTVPAAILVRMAAIDQHADVEMVISRAFACKVMC